MLLFSLVFPEIGSEAATSSELEQSIKEKGICDNGGTGAEKQLQSTMSDIRAMVDSLESLQK